MFFGGPRPPYPPVPPRRPFQGPQNPNRPNLLSHFQTPEGKLDFNKISGTAQQMKKLYGQFSPMLTKFFKK